MATTEKKIRFGVFGLGRGGCMIGSILAAGGEVVALCDKNEKLLTDYKNNEGTKNCAFYSDFDAFIQHDMDVVFLCNYFCEHAEYAIRAMRAGKHVLSETIPNITMAEGVKLCRAKEETGMTYGLFENYPYFKQNLEMKRLFEEGTLGEIVYAEGEYVHPMSPDTQNSLAPGERHWRNWTPRTYYTTHALAPLMQMTGALPTRVSAMASFHPEVAQGTALRTGDAAAIIMCQTDTDAVFRVTGWACFAPHGSYYRLCGTRGGVETNHDTGAMRLVYNDWTLPEGKPGSQTYDCDWPSKELGDLAAKSGHGGGDFFAIYFFIQALLKGEEPFWDVYRATRASSVAILAWRSILNGNMAYDVPDFRLEADRLKYENDNASPYPDENFNVNFPCSSKPYAPTEEDLAQARKRWNGQ